MDSNVVRDFCLLQQEHKSVKNRLLGEQKKHKETSKDAKQVLLNALQPGVPFYVDEDGGYCTVLRVEESSILPRRTEIHTLGDKIADSLREPPDALERSMEESELPILDFLVERFSEAVLGDKVYRAAPKRKLCISRVRSSTLHNRRGVEALSQEFRPVSDALTQARGSIAEKRDGCRTVLEDLKVKLAKTEEGVLSYMDTLPEGAVQKVNVRTQQGEAEYYLRTTDSAPVKKLATLTEKRTRSLLSQITSLTLKRYGVDPQERSVDTLKSVAASDFCADLRRELAGKISTTGTNSAKEKSRRVHLDRIPKPKAQGSSTAS